LPSLNVAIRGYQYKDPLTSTSQPEGLLPL